MVCRYKEKERVVLKEGCNRLEAMVSEVFGKLRWRYQRRIEN
jgi:hypothetical protein